MDPLRVPVVVARVRSHHRLARAALIRSRRGYTRVDGVRQARHTRGHGAVACSAAACAVATLGAADHVEGVFAVGGAASVAVLTNWKS